ncbi:hypothetical protein B0H11DRAFT_1684010, partial [Mycena galericulata]
GSLMCDECGFGVTCQSCCFEVHQKAPLHCVKMWNGKTWEPTVLRDHGFVYNMGHQGNPCPHPDRDISSLLVLHYNGHHLLHLRYCRCPDSEGMAKSNWYQIKKNGWFPA